MNRAEEKAKERYRLDPCNVDTQNKYHAYIEGYKQAERDLALTWEDINRIEIIIKDVYKDYPHGIEVKQFGTEVLKRFNELWKKKHCTE